MKNKALKFKKYLTKVIPLYLLMLLIGIVGCNIHVITNYITTWYMEATKSLSETLSIGIAILVYVIISTLMMYVAYSLDRKAANKYEELK